MIIRLVPKMVLFIFAVSVAVVAQTGNNKQFSNGGLTFDYPAGWTLQDDTNGDAQQLTLARASNDVQIRLFVHKGRVTPEKFADAKKAFIDPYVVSTAKQFVAMGAEPKQAPDSSEIAGVQADGVAITASLGGEPGAAKIYWALVGNRVVVLTYFGPDKELKEFAPAWDLVRTGLKIEDPKAIKKP
ncbi:MAG TPA: hypothetical protein VI306_14905 [Pyrinomonadaceae bacterium]